MITAIEFTDGTIATQCADGKWRNIENKNWYWEGKTIKFYTDGVDLDTSKGEINFNELHKRITADRIKGF